MKVYVVSRNFDRVEESSVEAVMNLLYLGKASVLALSEKVLKVSLRERYDLSPEFRVLMDGWDKIRIPVSVVLKDQPPRPVNLKSPTRSNLIARDKVCQFDDCQERNDLTIDHVYPSSRFEAEFSHMPFALNSWENLVMACKRHNNRKGNRTPEEAGMALKKPPKAPSEIVTPETWTRILPKEGNQACFWK